MLATRLRVALAVLSAGIRKETATQLDKRSKDLAKESLEVKVTVKRMKGIEQRSSWFLLHFQLELHHQTQTKSFTRNVHDLSGVLRTI